MLYSATSPARATGTPLTVKDSRFAPSTLLVQLRTQGSLPIETFSDRYLAQLSRRYVESPALFRDLVEQASQDSHVTLIGGTEALVLHAFLCAVAERMDVRITPVLPPEEQDAWTIGDDGPF